MSHCQQGASANILGIDIGSNSIGWALVNSAEKSKPDKITAVGVRIFQAGLDDLESDGKGKSRNTDRREARSRRRQYERRSRRMANLARALQRNQLLPEGDIDEPHERHLFLEKIDLEFGSPYELRVRALDKKLTPHELGRALYHLAHRRGFLSNRKSPIKKDKEERGMLAKIDGLEKEIKDTGARTLGEYFLRVGSKEIRIRSRHTSRKMYEDEFEFIWNKQAEFYPRLLTDTLKKKIQKIIFCQRPLKSVKRFIGDCELEKGRKRAPWGLLVSQRFRYLQKLNDLLIISNDNGHKRELSDEERQTLGDSLELKGDLTFGKMRKLLGLRGIKFNLELGEEKRIPGNRTAAKLVKIFGIDEWRDFGDERRDLIVHDLRSISNPETMKKRGMEVWGLDEEKADDLANIKLEEGYCSFSRQALENLLPLLENGTSLATAIKECYPEQSERKEALYDFLPMVESDDLPDLRNPIVERSLTELRKVVNAIIAEYGLPDKINVEFARELRQTAKQRGETSKRMSANRDSREKAAQEIIDETDIETPTRRDILKVQLAQECDWTCPYTGKKITIQSLLGDNPQFDIEHIIPFHRSLDDSYLNKTLCCAEENRKVKNNRTPYETYAGSDGWDDIIACVKKFKGSAGYAKLRRFRMKPDEVEEALADFTSRQLNDTRWASKWAKRYLGLLYGGTDSDGIDASGKRRVNAVTGQVTAFFRNEWGLNAVLGDGPGKSRDDHRHHAVDALVVALMTAAEVKKLNDAAGRAARAKKRKFEGVEPPWSGFAGEAVSLIRNIVPSHRLSKRVRGALHKETFYGRPRVDEKGKHYVHIRLPLESLSRKNVDDIVDPVIRETVKNKLDKIGGEPKTAFTDPKNHPCIHQPDGNKTTIHRVRIRQNLEPFHVGSGDARRYVKNDAIHHMVIYETAGKKEGTVKWDAEVVSLFEACQRKKAKQPIIQRNLSDGRKFIFSLARHEIIELDTLDGKSRAMYIVRTVPQSKQIFFVPINDAREKKKIKESKNVFSGLTALPESLRKRNCRKVVVTPLGEIRRAND